MRNLFLLIAVVAGLGGCATDLRNSDHEAIVKDGCQIGGCSSQLCVDSAKDSVSDCEWRDEYACYRTATCERQANGACGWTETDELRECVGGVQALR